MRKAYRLGFLIPLILPACDRGPRPSTLNGGEVSVQASTLPDFGSLPDFELIERSGKKITRRDLVGRTWVADFIFTNCPGPCPRLSAQLKKLQGELPDSIGLLSISVDPERDTPEALTSYAEGYGASEDRWLFLTGPKADIARLVNRGFRLALVESEDGGDITHSTRFVLIGPDGNIRGYYEGLDEDEVESLKRDAGALAGGS